MTRKIGMHSSLPIIDEKKRTLFLIVEQWIVTGKYSKDIKVRKS